MEYGNWRRILRRTSLPFQRAYATGRSQIDCIPARTARAKSRAASCDRVRYHVVAVLAARRASGWTAAASRPIGDRAQLGEHLVTVDKLDGTLPALADPLVRLGGPHIVPLLGR